MDAAERQELKQNEGGAPTRRQLDVLEAVAAGWTTEEIAARMHLSAHTVRHHRKKMLNRIGARSAPQAVAIGFRRGYLM